jgi:hypothetical protein
VVLLEAPRSTPNDGDPQLAMAEMEAVHVVLEAPWAPANHLGVADADVTALRVRWRRPPSHVWRCVWCSSADATAAITCGAACGARRSKRRGWQQITSGSQVRMRRPPLHVVLRVVLEAPRAAANPLGVSWGLQMRRANRLGVAAQTELLGHRMGILAKALIIADGAIACGEQRGKPPQGCMCRCDDDALGS